MNIIGNVLDLMTWLFLYIFIIKKSEYCHNYFFFHNVLFYSTILRFGKMVFILSPIIVMLSYLYTFDLVYKPSTTYFTSWFLWKSAQLALGAISMLIFPSIVGTFRKCFCRKKHFQLQTFQILHQIVS